MSKKGFGRPMVVRNPEQAAEIIESIKNGKRLDTSNFTYEPKRPIGEILGRTANTSSPDSINIKDIIKDNIARFSFYRNGKLMYEIVDCDGIARWLFPIDITNSEDIGSASFDREMKAIYLMRYIRKAIDNGELARVH